MSTIQNKVQLIGYLGKDPEIKNSEGGRKYARTTIATNENYQNAKGEKVKETQWHNLVAWGKLAEIMERYLRKGSEVVVEGKLSTKSYTDKEGIKRYFTEIQVNELFLVGKKPSEE